MRATAFVGTVVVLLLVVIVPTVCFAQATATDDTYVVSSSATTNFGTSPSLAVQSPGAFAFIRPDLSRLPAGLTASQVSKATIRLFVTAVTANGSFDVCEVAGPWKEGTLTYNTMPALGACATGGSVTTTASKNQYVDIDVTLEVTHWLNGTTNNGIILKPSAGSSISVTFESKESTSTSHDAELNVAYNTSLAQLPGQIGPAQVAPGLYAINISGSAATLLGPLGQCAAHNFATGINFSGTANCAQPSFLDLTGSLSAGQLPGTLVYNDQPNSYVAGKKQLFQASAATAGLSFGSGLTTDPTTLAIGDVWFNNVQGRLNFRLNGSTTTGFAFLTDLAGFATQSSLSAEVTRAQAAEAALSTSVSNEVTRATGAEAAEVAARQAAVTAETTRAQGAENTLTTNLASEVGRATSAESALNVSIAAETTRATGAEAALTTSVSAEVTRATAAEATKADLVKPVQVNNTAVAAGACVTATAVVLNPTQPAGQQVFVCDGGTMQWVSINDETALQAQIAALTANSATAASLAAEVTRAQAAEAALSSSISAETSRAQGAEAAEVAARQAAVTAEATRAQGAENTLTANLASEVGRATSAEGALNLSIAAETTRATGAETALTTSVSTEVTRATAAEATKADLVKPVQTDLTAAVNGTCTAVNAMVLNPNAASGQQLFVCRDIGNNTLQWQLVNDDSASSTADKAYTDQQVAAEAAARQAADSAETSRAQGAESALSSSISAETSRAQAAEATETTRATGAEATLSAGIAAETTRAMVAESTLTTSVNNEVTRATAAEATLTTSVNGKADLVKPVQVDNTAVAAGACVTATAVVLNPTQPAGQQVFVCDGGTMQWVSINDETALQAQIAALTANSATAASLAAEVARAQAAEAALSTSLSNEVTRAQAAESAEVAARQAAVTAETTRAQGAETTLGASIASETARAQTAEAGLSASVSAETSRATAAEAALATNLAGKANLAGGNSFTGNQTVSGLLSLSAAAAGNSQPSNLLRLNATDSSGNSQSTQLQTLADGSLSFQFGPTGSALPKLSINNGGLITFAAGQTFPGTQSALTAGNGISIVSNTVSNTGVLSFNGRLGAVSPASGDYSFSQVSGTITPGQVGAGTYAINISGNAATATTAATSTLAGNVTGIVAIANGGTGISTSPSAAGQYLRSSGANTWAVSAPQTSDLTGAPVRVSATINGSPNSGAGTTVTATASCSAGRVLLGGGAQVTASGGASQLAKVAVLESYPSSTTPGQWTATGILNTNLNQSNFMTVTAYALCSGT